MKKILVVDDSDILLKTLQTGFQKYQKHFLPIFAKDGLEAMNFLDAHSIDLVVTEYGISGRKIKNKGYQQIVSLIKRSG